MLPALLLLALVGQALTAGAAITSGLYRISSNYFLLDVISQTGSSVTLDATEKGTLGQLWSVIVRGKTATIQNAGTLDFLSVVVTPGPVETVVPGAKPYNWTIAVTADQDAQAQVATIMSSGKAVTMAFETEPLQLFDPTPGRNQQLWKFTPAVPQPRTYRVWNEAANLYLDQVLKADCDSEPEGCLVGSAFNASSRSQVWRVAGTSASGGRPTLQNAASGAFLTSVGDFDSYMGATKPDVDAVPWPWAYGFVGGQLTILDQDGLGAVTTLGLLGKQAGREVVLYASSEGPGTAPTQTWVFIPVP